MLSNVYKITTLKNNYENKKKEFLYYDNSTYDKEINDLNNKINDLELKLSLDNEKIEKYKEIIEHINDELKIFTNYIIEKNRIIKDKYYETEKYLYDKTKLNLDAIISNFDSFVKLIQNDKDLNKMENYLKFNLDTMENNMDELGIFVEKKDVYFKRTIKQLEDITQNVKEFIQ